MPEDTVTVPQGATIRKTVPVPQGATVRKSTPISTAQKVVGHVADVLPVAGAMIGGTLGAGAGTALEPGGGTVLGGIGGAGIGAGIGSAGKQGLRKMAGIPSPTTFGDTAKEISKDMLIQGSLQALGELPAAAFAKAAKLAPAKTLGAINRYIGLSKSDLPKWEKFNVQAVEDVARTVLEKVGIKKTLPEQHAAIESVRSNVNAATERLINSTKMGKLTDLHSLIYQTGADLIDSLELSGRTPEAIQAVDRNVDALLKAYPVSGGNATPSELFQLRRNIQKDIKWNVTDTQDVHQMFLKDIYHSVNDSIKHALPASEAREFSALNKIQHNLIIARDSSAERMVNIALSKDPGAATIAKRAAVGGVVGAGFGLLGGTMEGHPGTGAIAGGAMGATLGAVGFHGRELSHKAEAPVGDIRVQQTLEKVMPTLARMAKTSPQAARALQIVRSVMSDEKPLTSAQ